MDGNTTPKQPVTPLPSEELANDAHEAGAEADVTPRVSGDTHLPASESDQLRETDRTSDNPENDITKLPPG
jgi:hypothetical protein